MRKFINAKLNAVLSFALIIIAFILFSYFIQTKSDFFNTLLTNNLFGVLTYILLNITAIVFAPITVLPLIVVATGLWGWVNAGIITILGWTIGSILAFLIARKFGVPLIKKFISLEKIYKLEDKFSIGNNFWSVVFLRIIIPVDILSYALGLFSKIKLLPYSFATIIGITPFAFIFAYLGTVPFVYQIVLGLTVLIIFTIWLIVEDMFRK